MGKHDGQHGRGKERKGLQKILAGPVGTCRHASQRLRVTLAVAGIPFQATLLCGQTGGNQHIGSPRTMDQASIFTSMVIMQSLAIYKLGETRSCWIESTSDTETIHVTGNAASFNR